MVTIVAGHGSWRNFVVQKLTFVLEQRGAFFINM